MPIFHEYDWLFAFGTLAALLDSYNIGANDVANSFATSVSSKSLTLKQAMLAAAICEFLGGVLVGAKVASTIKNGIISLTEFQGNAGVQLLAFTCALTCSAIWLMIATRNSWPVSTTYSIVSALAGVGVAVGGPKAVQWGWNGGKGLGAIFAGFLIAPALAAGFASVVFLFTKYGVLLRKNSVKVALYVSPFYFFTVAAVCTLSIVFKGSPQLGLDKLPETTIAVAIVGTASVIAALSALFWLPYVYSKVVRNDYTIRWYHFFLGPALWWRETPSDAMDGTHDGAVVDYRVYHDDHGATELPITQPGSTPDHHASPSIEEKCNSDDVESSAARTPSTPRASVPLGQVETSAGSAPYKTLAFWTNPKSIVLFVWKAFSYGTSVDVHALQVSSGSDKENARINRMHLTAQQYDNKTEHLFSFLQVLTACTASFAHGANDLANAIGPYSAIYSIWSTSAPLGSKTNTETWQLVVGATMLVIGLATMGYKILAVLGNKLTLHSPSRGFSMEFGAAITVLLASQYGIPVSSTMCIVGGTLGVALCNGDIKSFNWKQLGWIMLGWVLTVPVAGVSAGCLCGMLLNAPHF